MSWICNTGTSRSTPTMFPPWTSRSSARSAARRLPARMTSGATSRAWAVPASSAIFATAPRYRNGILLLRFFRRDSLHNPYRFLSNSGSLGGEKFAQQIYCNTVKYVILLCKKKVWYRNQRISYRDLDPASNGPWTRSNII